MRIGVWLSVIVISGAALCGAFYLGRTYLDIIREGAMKDSIRVNSNVYRPVSAGNNQKALVLNPLPVYYLQAGVYSDLAGAQETAKQLRESGFVPYITQAEPYKIWLGVYRQRNDAELTKLQLRDKGMGSFTGSVVINGSNLKYDKGSEAFIKQAAPVLETYTGWLQENLELFNSGGVEALDGPAFQKQLSVAGKVYADLAVKVGEVSTNNEAISLRFGKLAEAAAAFEQELETFKVSRNQYHYMQLQCRMLSFVENYLLLWQEIGNSCKT